MAPGRQIRVEVKTDHNSGAIAREAAQWLRWCVVRTPSGLAKTSVVKPAKLPPVTRSASGVAGRYRDLVDEDDVVASDGITGPGANPFLDGTRVITNVDSRPHRYCQDGEVSGH